MSPRVILRRLAVAICALSAVAAAFFFLKAYEKEVLVTELINASTRGIPRKDVDATVLALSRTIYRRTNHAVQASALPLYDRLEATSFFNVGTSIALKHGIFGIEGSSSLGPCGTMTRILLNACWRIGIPARKLQILPDPRDGAGQHTMVEFRKGDRWQVISPSDSSFVWRNHRGEIATLDEIRSDPTIFAQIYEQEPGYRYHFRTTAHIRWSKLPIPARRFFRWILGPTRYERALTPVLYDQPRSLFLELALLCLALTGGLAVLLAPRTAERWRRVTLPGASRKVDDRSARDSRSITDGALTD